MTLAGNDVICFLRSSACRDTAPSQMLRDLLSRLAPEMPDRQALVRCFTEAFCFTEGQAYPIFGWSADGTGELKDPDLDSLLANRIGQTRTLWDRSEQTEPRAGRGGMS